MKLRLFSVWLLCLFLLNVSSAMVPAADGDESDEAAKIVAEVADSLQPDKPFTVRVRIESYRQRALASSLEMRSYVRVSESGGGAPDAVSVVLSPEGERGKVFLQESDNFWLYDPGARRPVKVSTSQRLLGDVTLADMTWFDIGSDYRAVLQGRENIFDADGDTVTVQRIELTAKTRSAPYPVLRLWVKGGSPQPVKAECESASGRVMKTIFYGRFRGFLGKSRPSEMTVVDNTGEGRATRIRFSDFAYRELDDAGYTPEAMPSVSRFADAEE